MIEKKLKSVADVTFVYATKLQCATRQSQRLQLHLEAKLCTRATKSRDKMQVCVCVSINQSCIFRVVLVIKSLQDPLKIWE